jgi:beta-lactam-binding protein with PASTA domain
VNILAAIGLSVLAVLLFFLTLDFFTNHGDYLRVPDMKGKDIGLATRELEAAGFEVLVQDSVYYDTVPPLTIMKQFPAPDATVKVNRTIYLTVNRLTPPMIQMPNLLGMTFRNAELELRSRGLRLGDTVYVPDIARNAVRDQLVHGVSVKGGSNIPMGARVTLVLGAGIGSEDIPVPDLFGMSYPEASALLEASGITLGVILPDANLADTTAGFVYWQNPEPLSPAGAPNRIRAGQMMDIRLSSSMPVREGETKEDFSPLP